MCGAGRPFLMLAFVLALLTACGGGETVLGERDGVEEGDADAGDDVGHPEDTADLTDDQVDAEAEADVCVPDCEGRQCGSDGCGGTCLPGCGEGEVCVASRGDCEPRRDWIEASPLSPYSSSVLAYDSARALTVLFGCTEARCDTQEYDGTSWTGLTPAASPPTGSSSAMVFDSARGLAVLFAGWSGYGWAGHTETWEYDGVTWTDVSSPIWPSSGAERADHAMAFDSVRRVVVLFGGREGRFMGDYYWADTWEYNGASWTEVAPSSAPSARCRHGMSYDAARGVVVMFGGDGGSAVLGDTWEFDGSSWREVTSSEGPPARYGHAMAYDSSRGVVVLFGGADGGDAPLADTWEYDGTWREVRTVHSPSSRWDQAMAYDSGRDAMVMFGGSSSGGYLGDTWEYRVP